MNDQPPQRRAALAAGAGGGEHDRPQRQFKIGRRRDDRAVVAAQFQQRATQPRGDRLRHGPAHRDRAGRRDQRQRGGLRQSPGPRRRRRPTRLTSPGGTSGISASTSMHNRVAGQRGQRRLFRRLPDHRVAADQREHRVPGPDGDGKIERRDHADRARADAIAPSADAPAARWRSSGRKAAGSGRRRSRRCRSSPALRPATPARILPVSSVTSMRQIGLVLAQLVADSPHEFAPPRRGHDAPAHEGAPRRFDRRRQRPPAWPRQSAPARCRRSAMHDQSLRRRRPASRRPLATASGSRHAQPREQSSRACRFMARLRRSRLTPHEAAVDLRAAIILAEAIVEKVVEIDLLLPHQARAGQLALASADRPRRTRPAAVVIWIALQASPSIVCP